MNTFGWKGNFWPLWFILGNHQKCSFWVFSGLKMPAGLQEVKVLKNKSRCPRGQGFKEVPRNPRSHKKSKSFERCKPQGGSGSLGTCANHLFIIITYYAITYVMITFTYVMITITYMMITFTYVMITFTYVMITFTYVMITGTYVMIYRHICDDIPSHMWW